MLKNIDQYLNKDKWNQFKNCEYASYLDYIEKFAPAFAPIMQQCLEDVRQYFEEDKHKDVDKYLYEPYFDYSKNIGKLHRPLTCIASYNACSDNPCTNVDEVFLIASAIENFQNAALIHDDIADCGELRRGKPCMHKKIGEGLAINAGDFGLSSVVGSVVQAAKNSSYSESKIMEIISWLVKMEYITIEGQAMDLGWAQEQRYDISEADYLCMAQKKTAYYSAAIPCVLGAICADADKDIVDGLCEFGKNLGLAFQIQDDILNLVEDEKSMQKKDFRSDITEGKRTLVVVKTFEFAKDNDADYVKDVLQSKCSDPKKIDKVVDIMLDCGAIEYSKDYAKQLSGQAKKHIEKISDSSWKDLLIDMANWAFMRSE